MSNLTDDEQKKIVDEAVDAYKKGDKSERQEIVKAMQFAGQKWLTNEEFDKHFEAGKKVAEDRGDEELSMMFVLYGAAHDSEKDDPVVLPVMFADWSPKDDQEKKMLMMGIGVKFADDFPDHMLTDVVHISEAWMVERKKDDESTLAPSEDPNRVEIVMVHSMSMDQRQSFWQAKILKDDNGKFTGLETVREDKFDPDAEAQLHKDMVDRLTLSIFMGNGEAKRVKMEMEEQDAQNR